MTGHSKALSIMVLTEDSGEDAYDTVLALVKEMLKLLVPRVHTHRIDFKPLEDKSARLAMRGTAWKSRKQLDQPDIMLLIRSIITELLKDESFVVYHIDGDCRWSKHESSENVREFESIMLSRIEAGVRTRFPDADTLNERMKRFRLVVPFYSIEAWLYRNGPEIRRLCGEEGCGQCHLKLTEWEQERAGLDELHQPKEEICFHDKHNAQLAKGFPANQVFAAGASFTQAVEHLLQCDALTNALQRTYAPSEPSSL